jgi:hypothetical protein
VSLPDSITESSIIEDCQGFVDAGNIEGRMTLDDFLNPAEERFGYRRIGICMYNRDSRK